MTKFNVIPFRSLLLMNVGFFCKLFTRFQSKIAKIRYLSCIVKFQLRKLGCTFIWYKNGVPQLQKLRCTSEVKKIKLRILRCAFTG